MHEFSLAEEVAAIVERHAKAQDLIRVNVLTLSVGSLTCIECEALCFALDVVLRNTVAAGAELRIEPIAARARCPQCGNEQEIEERYAPCLQCGTFGLQILSGEELRVKSIVGIEASEPPRRPGCA